MSKCTSHSNNVFIIKYIYTSKSDGGAVAFAM